MIRLNHPGMHQSAGRKDRDGGVTGPSPALRNYGPVEPPPPAPAAPTVPILPNRSEKNPRSRPSVGVVRLAGLIEATCSTPDLRIAETVPAASKLICTVVCSRALGVLNA